MSTGNLPDSFTTWIGRFANGLDAGTEPCAGLLPRLAQAGYIGVGVPAAKGGTGGDIVDAVSAVCAVARESLAASFVLWGHRTYIEYLLQSPNRHLEETFLAELLAGKMAGASGLSNAMKFLAGLEALQITAKADGDELILNGRMPWVTNLRPGCFQVAAVVERLDGGPAFVASLAHDDAGLVRSPDLDLMAMRSSDTAAVSLSGVRIGRDRILAADAGEWLPRVRPAFVALQCGMSIGLARRALEEAGQAAGSGRSVLGQPVAETAQALDRAEARLFAGLRSRQFEADAARRRVFCFRGHTWNQHG
jgi:alkylation response protein AidB-like acyl-CoA dehydrogenase